MSIQVVKRTRPVNNNGIAIINKQKPIFNINVSIKSDKESIVFEDTGEHDIEYKIFMDNLPKNRYNLKIEKVPPHKLQAFHVPKIVPSLKYVNLSDKIKTIYDQGSLGSCTANALCELFIYEYKNTKDPSRLFLYYNERAMEDSIPIDSGALLSDGVTSLIKDGVCDESKWPYDISKFAIKPPEICYQTATKISNAKHIVQDLNIMKNTLISGKPFCFGFMVYSQFESYQAYKKGMITMPKKGDMQLGGHAVICVGFDEAKKVFICRNSWGVGWGDKGNFYMPYAYMLDRKLTTDLWIINK